MTKIVENGQNTWGESRHASHGVPSLKGIFGIEIERNWICQLRRRRQAPWAPSPRRVRCSRMSQPPRDSSLRHQRPPARWRRRHGRRPSPVGAHESTTHSPFVNRCHSVQRQSVGGWVGRRTKTTTYCTKHVICTPFLSNWLMKCFLGHIWIN